MKRKIILGFAIILLVFCACGEMSAADSLL